MRRHQGLQDVAIAASCSYTPFDTRWRYQRRGLSRVPADQCVASCSESSGTGISRERNLNFVLESQNPDGSWSYAVDGVRDFVDHFHTCFVMKALAKIHALTGPSRLSRLRSRRACDYYLTHLFDADGLPRPFSKAPRLTVYKRELYDCAECDQSVPAAARPFPELERDTRRRSWPSSCATGSSPTARSVRVSCCSAGTTCRCIAGRSRRCSAASRSSCSRGRGTGTPADGVRTVAHASTSCQRSRWSALWNRSMCGICGQFNFATTRAGRSGHHLVGWRRSIAHRGPDDEGYFVEGPIGSRIPPAVDHRPRRRPSADVRRRGDRLGRSSTARSTTSRSCASSSRQRGHRFRTQSDTEVIVHGYKEWGTGVFDRLNGMFGLAIWDVAAKRLVVARDAMGIKLIYYRDRRTDD